MNQVILDQRLKLERKGERAKEQEIE